MVHEIQDERYNIVEEAIYDAFFLILKEKEINKITVADVTKKAGIVRSTFYNHYENIPDLVSAIEERTIQDIFHMLESFHAKEDQEICESFYLSLCEYTMINPFLAELVRSPRGDEFINKTLTMFHQYVAKLSQKQDIGSHNAEEFSYAIASAIGSTIGILHKWTTDQFTVPKETIAAIMTKIYMTTIRPLMTD